MKHFFTIFMASCLVFLTTTASSPFSNPENNNALKSLRGRNLPAGHPLKTRDAQTADRLKDAAVMQYPSSSKHYNWTGDEWDFYQDIIYDNQGREIERISGLMKVVTAYDDVEETVTKWHQQKDNDLAPWTTYKKEVTRLTDNYLNELWEMVDGQLVLTQGSKWVNSENTVDKTTTDLWESWTYNAALAKYEMNSGYKEVAVVSETGQLLTDTGYFWEDGDWVTEYADTYIYDNEDVLTQMTFCYYEEAYTECERIEFVFEGAGAPEKAFVYTDEGSGYELTGRYINLQWIDWGNVPYYTEDNSGVQFATMQLVIDPDGDLTSDANYINSEQFENDEDGNYSHYYWINGQWLIDDYYFTETEGSADAVITAYAFDYEEGVDEDCNVFLVGDKNVSTIGTNQTSMVNYEWTKTSEPCNYEWVNIYEVIENTTPTTHETITRSMQAEIAIENIEYEEWDANGHPMVERSSAKMGETMYFYEEYNYNNTYEGALRTSTITSFREAQDDDFVLTEKIEYVYGGTGLAPYETTKAAGVFPTVFDAGFNVRLTEISSLKLLSVQGQIFWQKASTAGELFVPGNHLPQGVYILLISTDTGGTETFKLIKK